MEFSFKLYDFMKDIDSDPQAIVMWAAFGVPLTMLALTFPLFLFRKMGLYPALKPYYRVLYLSLGISWILGFITQMIFFFTAVSGVRMALIWIIMFFVYFTFCSFKRRQLNRWLDALSKTKADKR